jgi:hypothetical protein
VRVGRDKAPIAGKGWFDVDNYSPDDAASLNGSSPPAWGLKSGPVSGVLVLDLDAEGWRESFQQITGHPITDLPPTIEWSSGKPGRSGRAFQVDPEWWPHLRNRVPFTRPWRDGDPLSANGEREPITVWELRWDRHQSVIIGAHPETGSYRWLPGHSPREISDPAMAPDWLLDALLVQELPDAPQLVPSTDDANRAVVMLNHLPAVEHSSYDSWLRIGMALHHTAPGLLKAWVDWSSKMPNFDEAECLAKWESFGKGHKGQPATIGTLHYLAKQHGYKEPKRKRHQKAPQTNTAAASAGSPPPSPAPLPEAPFRILGWSTKMDAIWVQTGKTGTVASIPPTKNGLQRIAPLPYWETLYPGRNGPGWDAAISSICEQAHDLRQTFTPDRIRGRGVWLDNNRVVWHLGNRLEVDGQLLPLTALRDSGWTYASLPALEIDPSVAPLSDVEGSAILALIHNRMQWENAGDGLLTAGHAVLGNICGALDIRPGLQLTGSSGGGKSTTERTISRPLQGGLGVRPSGATEAGIRQRMQSDALPVVIDESEQESPKVREGHLKLLRLSFDGQEQIKGTAGGQALTYTMRSSITLIGINATVPNLADRNRLVVIRPRKMPSTQWTAFQLQRDALISVETGRRLIRRSVSNLKALVANIKTFQAVLAGQGLAGRSAEVYGSLLAGAHHLTSTAVLEPAQALAWLDSVGWTGLDEETEEAIASDAEGRACLEHLLGHSVPWKCSQTGSIAVLELLKIAQGLSQTMGEDNASELNKAEAVKALGRLGVKLDRELGVVVSMVVSKACTVFSSTRWANGAHHDRLLELKGAKPLASPVRFPQGRNARGVSLPIELLDPEP